MSLESNQPSLRVAIIGGGMGGLVLAMCLKKYAPDVDFDIYESAAELTEIGAGIGMTPRIWWIMKELGLEDELLTIAGSKDRDGFPLQHRKGDEEQGVHIAYTERIYTFHRSIMQQLLAKHLDAGDKIHFSKRLKSYSETSATEPITLTFKDGTTATCDLVVGSDGIRSAVRRTMFNELADDAEKHGDGEKATRLRDMIEPVYTGQIAYRGVVPTSALSDEIVQYAKAPLLDMMFYPVSGGKLVNALAVKYTPGHGRTYDGPWVKPTTAGDVVKLFEGWETNALTLFKAVTEPLCWAIHTVPDLPTYVKGRVALIGDAAHAQLPHQGAGVGQASEDGYILATILAHPSVTLNNLPAALAVYDDVQRPFSQSVLHGSDRNGMNFQLRRAGWENVSAEDSKAGRYAPELLAAVGEEVIKQVKWAYETNIEDDRARVVERVAALVA
ncbi:hypothetical protein GSI_03199 [Ganoderma sinense ZZ0214-1]|uniref:FAD-binding domain-containing protein n=1 Tax=Ganoderma sinense ZZ0214-1 TaxID=1077348 RepID=A0A2G8SKY5_9APHY|nr:hypothetical protein GSI_03199 [Ganoderma sinense ZZ0214-1]